MKKNNRTMLIFAIGSIPLMMTLGNSMLIPILPEVKAELNLSQLQVSLIITVFSIAAAVMIPIAGYLSDRYSRKFIIIPSLILFGGGALLAGLGAAFFSNAYAWILFGRILQGIGAAGAAPIAMALIGDLFRGAERSRILGIFEASNGLGKVLSPIFGALLALIGWYTLFFAFPILSLTSLIFVWIFVKENSYRQMPPPFKKYVRGLLSVFKYEGRWLLTVYLAGGTCLFTLFGILFYLSDVLETTYQIDGARKGFVLAIPLLVMVTTSYLTGSKIGSSLKKMKFYSFLGFIFMTISYAALVPFDNLVPFLIVLSLSSIGAGLALPCINSLITGSVGKERRGFVSSIYGSVRFFGVAFGPPVFTRLMEWSRPGMFLSIAGFTLLVAILILLLVRVSDKDEEKMKKKKIIYNYV